MPNLVLIVEDEALLARNVKTYLERAGYEAVIADSLKAAKAHYEELKPDAVLVDQNLPDGSGLDLVRIIRAADRTTKLVMITAHGSVETAVDAMKAGADDFLTKPVPLSAITLLLDKLLQQARMEGSLSYFQRKEEQRSGSDRIIGNSVVVQQLKARLRMISDVEANAPAGAAGPPVLVLGETGSGKELVARALHFDGPRRRQSFVEVNCAALPDQLVESELFGHERGAFTDARERKIGLLQAADGGTLFLDEIGELPLATQAKLLKAIEEKTVRPVGGLRDRPVNVRLVAATNASLEDKVRQGEFRADLLYRLNTITIATPPLRERGDDILLLADTFLAEFRNRYGRTALQLSARARQALLAHSWPGNVRELRNVMEQTCLLTSGDTINPGDLSLREPGPIQPAGSAESGTLNDVERDLIVNALRTTAGNVTLAARRLGVSRDTLRYRIEKYALRRDDFA